MSKNRKMPPGLYGVAMFKFGKGLFFLLAAFGIYGLADQNLPAAFRQALTGLNLDPEKEFWVNLASTLSQITPKNMLWVASGAGLYASISWIETIGLLFRQNWAVWLTLVEGAFFIPIELLIV